MYDDSFVVLASTSAERRKRWEFDGESGPSLFGQVGRVGMMYVRGREKRHVGADEILHGLLDMHHLVPQVWCQWTP